MAAASGFPPRCAISTSRPASGPSSRLLRRFHRLRAGRSRRGARPGRARPRGAPGPPLRRAARRRHRRDEDDRRRALYRLCRKQASGDAGGPEAHSQRRAVRPFHSLRRDRPLFRGRQRLFLGQPGDRHGRADDPGRDDRPRHRRRRGGLRHQWNDARLGRPARPDPRFLPAFRQEPQRHGAGRRRRHVRAGGRGHRAGARRQASGGPRRLWHQQRRTRPGASRRGVRRRLHGDGARRRRPLADRHRLCQRPRHRHGGERRQRGRGPQHRLRRPLRPSARLLDQAGPWPCLGRGGRAGAGRLDHGLARTGRAAQSQHRDSGCRTAGSVWSGRSRSRRESGRSCPIPWLSAASTPR